MTEEELKKKAEECYWSSDANGSLSSKKCYTLGYIAGAKENQPTVEEMLKRLLKGGYVKSGIYEKKENIKNARKKLFDILTDYEIGNYDNNIHQFYKDVYDIHNELMELAE